MATLCKHITCTFIALGALCYSQTAVTGASFGVDRSGSQIFLVGTIVPGDYERLTDLLKRSRRLVTAVDLISPGGNVQESIKIGRLIRSLSLSTNAPSTADFAPEARHLMCSQAAMIDPSSSGTCVSACFLIWSGGVVRSGNDIHIHRIAFDKSFYGSLSPTDAHAKYQDGLKEVHGYLQEMDIPDHIYMQMISMPSYSTMPLEDSGSLWTTPSFGEWMTARCGSPSNRVDSSCELNQWTKAAEDAVRKFREGD